MAFRSQRRTVFVYGFAKSERDNIKGDELDFWRRVASSFFALDDQQIQALLDNGAATEVWRREGD